MLKHVITGTITAILAATALSAPAFADSYYEGADPNARVRAIDEMQTNSISNTSAHTGRTFFGVSENGPLDSGDYYQGANRPT